MKLELATVLDCSDVGCRVKPLESDAFIEARYSRLVQNRIMIKPAHLVAVDMSVNPPEIVWRWRRAIVIELSPDIVVVGDIQGHPGKLTSVPDLPLALALDDEVWMCGTGRAFEVHDIIVDDIPAHPKRLLEYITPIIDDIYGNPANT